MKNKMPSFRHHRRPFVKIYFIFLLVNSQTNKKFCLKASSLPSFRHLILQFGRKNNMYVPKNKKNKIKVIPYQGKLFLNRDISSTCPPSNSEKAIIF